jgi:hypothetical protein
MRLLKLGGLFGLSLALVGLVIALPSIAFGDEGRRDFHAEFLGVNETPSISTEATASLRLHINGSGDNATIDYTLRFSGLRAPVTQAHVHFGQTRVAGGVVFFLCGTPVAPGPAGTPACSDPPGTSGTVKGTITKANIVAAAAAQGIAAGEMGRVVQAIRDGAAYGNVHSSTFPTGETRGQLRPQ